MTQYLDLILENSLNVEIGFGAEDLEEDSAADLLGIIPMLRERGCFITAHGPFWDLCPGSVDPGVREVSRLRLHKLFDLMEKVSPSQIVCHTGFDPRHHRGHRRIWIQNSLIIWEPLVRRAEALNAPLILENVWEEDPEVHLDLLRRINSPWFGFCLDIGHQHAFSRTALGEWLDATAPWLKEIHLHDNDGSFDDHLPVGMGNIDFDFLFSFLGAENICPILTLEPHTEEHLYRSLSGLAEMASFRDYLHLTAET
ncbi:MAG: sugar phosphate isomerase/epimerase family protein [Syntrophobacteraceae bacterium]